MTLPVRRHSTDMERPTTDRDPFSEFSRFNRQLWEMLERPPWPSAEQGFVPPADVEETEDAFVVEIELPGVEREDIDVELVGRRLHVHGERKERERVGILRRRTRKVGEFCYQVVLPEGVADGDVEAQFSNGVLTLRIPKEEKARARRIEVR